MSMQRESFLLFDKMLYMSIFIATLIIKVAFFINIFILPVSCIKYFFYLYCEIFYCNYLRSKYEQARINIQNRTTTI